MKFNEQDKADTKMYAMHFLEYSLDTYGYPSNYREDDLSIKITRDGYPLVVATMDAQFYKPMRNGFKGTMPKDLYAFAETIAVTAGVANLAFNEGQAVIADKMSKRYAALMKKIRKFSDAERALLYRFLD
jgi:hypothetical protein